MTTTVARVGGVILSSEGPRPLMLLGAGASMKSGVPLADDLAALAARHAYCREHGIDPRNPAVKRSDWMPWLRSAHSWFDEGIGLSDQYPKLVERLLQPREERREFFLQHISPRVPRSPGYGALAKLV